MIASLPTKRPLIMGIVNITPDSFSGDGLMARVDFVSAAISQALQMVEDGADILDIGGESSRPGSVSIPVDEELKRVIPVLQKLRTTLPKPCLISIDTVKSEVADQAIKLGAVIINDISALTADPHMAAVASQHKAHVVLMDNRSDATRVQHRGKIGGEYLAAAHTSIIESVKAHLAERIAFAEQAGITRDKIILDPGLGFGKTVQQNLQLIKNIPELTKMGFAVLTGPSRKSFIGQILDVSVNDRLEGTAALVSLSAFLGASILRVHDVKFMAQAATIAAKTAE